MTRPRWINAQEAMPDDSACVMFQYDLGCRALNEIDPEHPKIDIGRVDLGEGYVYGFGSCGGINVDCILRWYPIPDPFPSDTQPEDVPAVPVQTYEQGVVDASQGIIAKLKAELERATIFLSRANTVENRCWCGGVIKICSALIEDIEGGAQCSDVPAKDDPVFSTKPHDRSVMVRVPRDNLEAFLRHVARGVCPFDYDECPGVVDDCTDCWKQWFGGGKS